MRRAWLVVASLVGATITCLAPASAQAHQDHASGNRLLTITIPARHGEIPAGWLPYPGPPRAAVLLPAGYDSHKRYPLVLNLGGLGGDYQRAAFGTSFHINAIVVTPEPYDGWYVDWWNHGQRGNPAWESYFLNDVIPTILARYPIRPGRRWHAVVGISMGGLGAAYLGGRLPGFFGSVASMSGFLDPQYYGVLTDEAMGLISSGSTGSQTSLYAVYGPPNGFYAAGHNPTRLVTNLRQTRVFETNGTGVPGSGELSDPADIPSGSALEGLIIHPMNEDFHRAALAAGLDLTYDEHPGGHDAPNFALEMSQMLAWGLFKPVPTNPHTWTNDTVATNGTLWDITYRFAQPPIKVVRFHQSGDLLSISAAGSPVTLMTASGCRITTRTPATVHLSNRCA